MKKLLPLLFSIFIIIGCTKQMDTPSRKVEEFLEKYQKMDTLVLKDLDRVIEKDSQMTTKQKKEYKELLKKQYQNLSYKIMEEEETSPQTATVKVEIEVLDYKTAIEKAEKVYQAGTQEYMEEKIRAMKQNTGKTKYKLSFFLVREDKGWKIEELSEEDLKKIHGIY